MSKVKNLVSRYLGAVSINQSMVVLLVDHLTHSYAMVAGTDVSGKASGVAAVVAGLEALIVMALLVIVMRTTQHLMVVVLLWMQMMRLTQVDDVHTQHH